MSGTRRVSFTFFPRFPEAERGNFAHLERLGQSALSPARRPQLSAPSVTTVHTQRVPRGLGRKSPALVAPWTLAPPHPSAAAFSLRKMLAVPHGPAEWSDAYSDLGRSSERGPQIAKRFQRARWTEFLSEDDLER